MEESGLKKCYLGLVKGENSVRHFLLLIIRLYWGGLLIMTGLGKWLNLEGVSEFFTQLNIPAPMATAFIVGLFEFVGGISLFLGLFARLFTIPLLVIFIVAYLTAHAEALVTFFINPEVFIAQTPFLFLFATLIVFCFGSGAASIDYWIEKKAFGKAL